MEYVYYRKNSKEYMHYWAPDKGGPIYSHPGRETPGQQPVGAKTTLTCQGWKSFLEAIESYEHKKKAIIN